MAKSTPATLALEKAGVAFTLHEYDYDPSATRIGMQAAEALGIEPARLLKTLMARAGDVVCVLAPSDREVKLKNSPRRPAPRARPCSAPPKPSASPAIMSAAFLLSVKKTGARVNRQVGCGVRSHRLQWRQAWPSGRTGAGGFGANIIGDDRGDLLISASARPHHPT